MPSLRSTTHRESERTRPTAARLRRARRRLIFALDVASLAEVDDYVAQLAGEVGLFKVGKQLFVHAGPEVVRRIQNNGGQVFLDLKFHDIPQTAAQAAVEAARLRVRMLTLHAGGGSSMLEAARIAVRRACRAERLPRPLLLAVTVLTSLDRDDLHDVGVRTGPLAQAVRLGRLAQAAGVEGLVASAQELPALRRACAEKLAFVVPGIRPQEDSAQNRRHDQKRVVTPRAAMQSGADYIVVGRPIRDAPDPRAAARRIVEDMALGLENRPDLLSRTRSRG